MEVSTYVWHGCLRPGCKRRLLRACLYASRKARPSTPPPMTMTLAIKRAKGAPTMEIVSVHGLFTRSSSRVVGQTERQTLSSLLPPT